MKKAPSQRLLARLRAMGLDIVDGAVVQRTYAGIWQRREGAWSWALVDANNFELSVGSQYPVTRLLKGRIMATQHWNNDDLHVDPWEAISEGQRGDYRYVFEESPWWSLKSKGGVLS
jgi:hypothetical protein